jgi:hypothetical protein
MMSDSNTTIIRPVYYRIIERRGKIWAFREGETIDALFTAQHPVTLKVKCGVFSSQVGVKKHN